MQLLPFIDSPTNGMSPVVNTTRYTDVKCSGGQLSASVTCIKCWVTNSLISSFYSLLNVYGVTSIQVIMQVPWIIINCADRTSWNDVMRACAQILDLNLFADSNVSNKLSRQVRVKINLGPKDRYNCQQFDLICAIFQSRVSFVGRTFLGGSIDCSRADSLLFIWQLIFCACSWTTIRNLQSWPGTIKTRRRLGFIWNSCDRLSHPASRLFYVRVRLCLVASVCLTIAYMCIASLIAWYSHWKNFRHCSITVHKFAAVTGAQ